MSDAKNPESKVARQGILRDVKSTLDELFSARPTLEQQVQIDVLFGLLGCMARADRLVSTEETAYTEKLMDDLDLATSSRKRAAEAFTRGCRRELDPDGEVQRFLELYAQGSAQVARLYDCLLRLAAADLRIHPKERELLRKISSQLGFPVDEMDARLQKILYVI